MTGQDIGLILGGILLCLLFGDLIIELGERVRKKADRGA